MPNIKYLALGFLLWPLVSMSADKHVHGEAELFIAVEDNQVLLEFRSPADNIIGFEHAPVTQAQFSKLNNSLSILEDYQSIASFSGNKCQKVGSIIKSPFDDHQHSSSHEHEHEHEHHDDDNANHSDFNARYSLSCDSPEDQLGTLKINAFNNFKGINNITIRWITSKGQGSAKATLETNAITLE